MLFRSKDFIYGTWSLNPNNETSAFWCIKVKEEEEKKIIDLLKKYSLKIYNSSDSCLLVLNRFSDSSNYGYPKIECIDTSKIIRECYKDKYPVPTFYNQNVFYTSETAYHLTNDFTIYVFESKKGIFLPKEQLPKNKYMPEEWEHGISKGVALSEKQNVIIYWLIIW